MSFEETKEMQQMYTMFRSCVYIVLIIELVMNLPVPVDNPLIAFLFKLLDSLQVFNSVGSCKIIEFVCVIITCIGTKAKKSLNFSMRNMVIIPLIIGVVSTALCFVFYQGHWGGVTSFGVSGNRLLYAACSVIGLMMVNQGLDGLARYYNHKVGEDKFNFDNESFVQTRDKVENEYSVNIPMIYYHLKKMHHGWINICNPFRGTLVLGTPGSGKSFSIIEPFIRQHAAKGFTLMVYDYKFPTLARNLFYQYCKNKHYGHLPAGCKFHVVNFSDVEHSHRVNPIQKKYIPDLAAASETAATLLAALNKGGGEKKGGSEAFFTNSAENFLAAIIYFFVNFHPTGFYRGKKCRHFISCRGEKLEVIIRGRNDLEAINAKGERVLDFMDISRGNVSVDEDNMFAPLVGFKYHDMTGNLILIESEWWEDDKGNTVVPDTITGEFSDMPHVLSLLGKSYSNVFDLLLGDAHIASLMAPFASAYKNRAMDQLEGMAGTLRVNTARLVSPEAYWVLTGDDFDIKISDPKNPSYLVIANDPEKEEVMGSLNAVILNRLVTRVNSRGNIPVSLIIDELPTLYFHKLDRLIGTARSNKVAVTLGFQELPQLEADYGKNGMHKILSTCGNVFMGAARNKETLEWASNDVFGKVKQKSRSVTIDDKRTSICIQEKMDNLVPAAKIADLATGWLAGQAARDFSETDKKAFSGFDINESEDFKTSKYFCKTHFDKGRISKEEKHYRDLPKIYTFPDVREKEIILNRNFERVDAEVDCIICEILGQTVSDSLRKVIIRENLRIPRINGELAF